MLPLNFYVVFGPEVLPHVQMLTDAFKVERYQWLQSHFEGNLSKANESMFGPGVIHALPAWSQECMELIALEYAGPHAREVKGLCAMIALGHWPGADVSPPDGGDGVRRKPIKPTPRGPAGAKASRRPERARA